jgi:hypothetical protein
MGFAASMGWGEIMGEECQGNAPQIDFDNIAGVRMRDCCHLPAQQRRSWNQQTYNDFSAGTSAGGRFVQGTLTRGPDDLDDFQIDGLDARCTYRPLDGVNPHNDFQSRHRGLSRQRQRLGQRQQLVVGPGDGLVSGSLESTCPETGWCFGHLHLRKAAGH